MLYERIKALCKERGMTVAELERQIGAARGYISKIDKHEPSVKKMAMIADRLGVTIDELKGKQEGDDGYYVYGETARIAQEIFINPGLHILFDAARDVDPSDLVIVAEMIKRMKGTNRDA